MEVISQMQGRDEIEIGWFRDVNLKKNSCSMANFSAAKNIHTSTQDFFRTEHYLILFLENGLP